MQTRVIWHGMARIYEWSITFFSFFAAAKKELFMLYFAVYTIETLLREYLNLVFAHSEMLNFEVMGLLMLRNIPMNELFEKLC